MKGVYALLLSINRDISQKIGALGIINFKKGVYAYIGSAQNNLEKRLKRHFSKEKKMHWHIDYLLSSESVNAKKAFYINRNKIEECRIAKSLNSNESINHFGCSDCECSSHLFKINDESFFCKMEMKEYNKGAEN